ncbi:M3 family oligoendopeptidase [Candidatus Margulisiibacteriota bacterium]
MKKKVVLYQAHKIQWDLSDLYSSIRDKKITTDISRARKKAQLFQKKYKPLLSKNISLSHLKKIIPSIIKDYVIIVTITTKLIVHAQLVFEAQTNKHEHGAFLQNIQQIVTDIQNHLVFWEVAWTKLDEKIVRKIYLLPSIKKYTHYLQHLRLYAKHTLSEKEEQIMSLKANTGSRAFSRLFDEVFGKMKFTIKEKNKTIEKSEEEILSMLYSPKRPVRKRAQESLTKGLLNQQHVITYIFNILLEDHRITDDIRHFKHHMDSRNLSNEISQEMVSNLRSTVKAFYPLVEKFYMLKKKLLKYDTLYDYDRYAPVFPSQKKYAWNECREIIEKGYDHFDTDIGDIVRLFYDKKWIDAELRDGKRSGAFSCNTTPDLHPYILVNYTGQIRDVMILAHELGHGIHQYLARDIGILESDAPLTLAETASVFGEMIIFDQLIKKEKSVKIRLGMLCNKIQDIFATVFRQIVMTEFEDSVHTARKKEGELTNDRYSELWIQVNSPMHGRAVTLTENYRYWWMYIPHFIHSPFYCYAYSFAQLLVLSLYQLYKKDTKGFVPKFKKILSLGGSEKPEKICGYAGLDIKKKDFWKEGLRLIEGMVGEVEKLVRKL